MAYHRYRQNKIRVVFFTSLPRVSILPIVIVKLSLGKLVGHNSLLVSWELSWFNSFRAVGTVIEERDGMIKRDFPWKFIRFILFMPTIDF